MQAIETVYKGYRFRSRLEARWAVFFDKCGCKWDYEPEGFVLSNEVCYLPDFRLSYNDGRPDIWVEIKPNVEIDDDALLKLWYLNYDTGAVSVLLSGDPYDIYCTHDGKVYRPSIDDTNNNHLAFSVGETSHWLLGLCCQIDYATQAEFDASENRNIYNGLLKLFLPIVRAQKAAELARAARFEHGEHGGR